LKLCNSNLKIKKNYNCWNRW